MTDKAMKEEMGQTHAPEATAPPVAGLGSLAGSIGARRLWIIIITMPVFFLIAVAVIIAVFGKPDGKPEKPAQAAATTTQEWRAPTGSDPLGMGGIASGAIALDGDRLAVRFDGPDGAVVVVYDLVKKSEIARIPFTGQNPAATVTGDQ